MPPRVTITPPDDLTIVYTRTFDAPRRLVWEGFFSPPRMRRWMLPPPQWTLTEAHCDPRNGGTLKLQWKSAEADPAMTLTGEFSDVVLHERATHTETFTMANGQVMGRQLETHEFTEANGKTTVRITQRYETKEARDGALGSGMDEEAAEEGYARLDAVLAEG